MKFDEMSDEMKLVDQFMCLHEAGIVFTYSDFKELTPFQQRIYIAVKKVLNNQEKAMWLKALGQEEMALVLTHDPETMDGADLERLVVQLEKQRRAK